MSKASREATCWACGWTGPRGKNGRFFDTHTCPKAGQSTGDTGKEACPLHGADYPLVWIVGPYSTFKRCNHPHCGVKGGKPFVVYAPKGEIEPFSGAPDGTPDDSPSPSSPSPSPAPPVPTPPATASKAPTVMSASLTLETLGPIGDAVKAYVEARANEIATERALQAVAELGERGPIAVEWKVNSAPFAKIEGAAHKALPRLLKLYAAGFRNFLIVGPAGSGKTTLARNLATALSLGFGFASCTGGMSESVLTGRAIPNLTTGATEYQGTMFVECYENGGVFLLDEVDAADPNVLLIGNAALDNGVLPLPNREATPTANRHANSVIICAANTWGTGADRQYVGRNQLDAAFLDRFVGTTLEVDYDRDLESALAGDPHVCARVWEVRSKVADLKLRRVVGTRFLLAVVRLVKGAGETLDKALTACTAGWTTDERTKVGIKAEAAS